MKEIKTCVICQTGIDFEKDSYVIIREYKEGKYLNEIYAHVNCWKEHMSNKGMLRQQLIDANKVLKGITAGGVKYG